MTASPLGFATHVANTLRRFTMNYATERKTYRTFLNSGSAVRDMITKHLGKDGALPDALVEALAQEHALAYSCTVEQNKDGAWKFKDAQGERHAAAQMQWGRMVDPYHKRVRSNRGGARDVNRKDPVSELIAGFWDLTAKQRADFLARIK
jgi:hypothetical protein